MVGADFINAKSIIFWNYLHFEPKTRTIHLKPNAVNYRAIFHSKLCFGIKFKKDSLTLLEKWLHLKKALSGLSSNLKTVQKD